MPFQSILNIHNNKSDILINSHHHVTIKPLPKTTISTELECFIQTDCIRDNDSSLSSDELLSDNNNNNNNKCNNNNNNNNNNDNKWILYLNNIDKLFSLKIHQLSMGNIDYLFVFGAFIFGSKFMPITILISIFIVELSGFLFLLISCFITVCLTQFLKKLFGRNRPDPKLIANKILDFRSRLTNKSFPSGDTAQSAAYATSLFLLTNNIWLLLLIPNCAWSRVYFGCHFIGDCFFGAAIGFIIPYLLYLLTQSSDLFGNTQHIIQDYWMH